MIWNGRFIAGVLFVSPGATAAEPDPTGFSLGDTILAQVITAMHAVAVDGPRIWLGDTGQRDAPFARWPWADGEDGYALPTDGSPGGYRMVLRAQAEWGESGDRDRHRDRFDLLCEGSWRFGVDASLDRWRGDNDDLDLVCANLLWRPAQGPAGLVRIGGGPRWMEQHDDGRTGFGFLYEVETYPVRPLILTIRGEAGWLDDATLWRIRATAGLSLWRIETYAGFDALAISDRLESGPVAGVRLRW